MRLTHAPLHRRLDHARTGQQPAHEVAGTPTIAPTSAPRAHRRGRSCVVSSRAYRMATTASSTTQTRRYRTLGRRLILLTQMVCVAVALCATLAHADSTQTLALAGSVGQVLTNIRNWLMGVLAGLATVFLTVGGVRRVFGGGDPGEQAKAKEAFKAAAIGYSLAALAPLVVTVLQGIVGA
jgi:type IV secretory pathway VirB2 component (pilin)